MITIRIRESDALLLGALLYKFSPTFRGCANTAVRLALKAAIKK